MPGFLSDAALAQIRKAIKGATDTFFVRPVTLHHATPKISIFNESREGMYTPQDYPLNALKLPENSGSEGGATNALSSKGSADLTEGVLFFNVEDLAAAGLVDATGVVPRVSIVAGVDTITDAGELLNIEGVNEVGPMGSGFALVKIHYKKSLRKNG